MHGLPGIKRIIKFDFKNEPYIVVLKLHFDFHSKTLLAKKKLTQRINYQK